MDQNTARRGLPRLQHMLFCSQCAVCSHDNPLSICNGHRRPDLTMKLSSRDPKDKRLRAISRTITAAPNYTNVIPHRQRMPSSNAYDSKLQRKKLFCRPRRRRSTRTRRLFRREPQSAPKRPHPKLRWSRARRARAKVVMCGIPTMIEVCPMKTAGWHVVKMKDQSRARFTKSVSLI